MWEILKKLFVNDPELLQIEKRFSRLSLFLMDNKINERKNKKKWTKRWTVRNIKECKHENESL